MEANDEEIEALRRRAYGPAPDLHDDPVAWRRLRDLEGAKKLAQAPPQPEATPLAVAEHPAPPTAADTDPRTDPVEQAPSRPLRLYRATRRARRSSVLIGVGATLVATSVLAAVILVPRVQVDPFQAGARQVARLSLDSDFTTPAFFAGTDDVFGFEQFHGLRAVVSRTGFFAMSSDENDDCLSIYSEANMVAATSDSFSGQAVGGCAAGGFPAIVQFRPDAEGSPDELRSAFPAPAALQFVYDRTNREVVVFVAAG
ncbi:hypothetical protein C5B96_00220 [Subtercola sp. Z020]|uniref:hypothetical protein n=1 Tax=Subtercola sp. Z020 TaxID=2080582 RepID=UPI000CE785B4|nr:hypothetical protein [Subtercola sp. Z020]PPF90133.1 hypothetical protein C5B96_00220 [Subtercola sp. Z020]